MLKHVTFNDISIKTNVEFFSNWCWMVFLKLM